MAQATDAVWISVLPSLDGFADGVIKGAGRQTDRSGKLLGGRFGKAMIAGAAAIGTGVAMAGKALYGVGETFNEVTNTIRVGTGATGDDLDALVDSAKNVGRTVPAEFEDIGTVVADLNTRLGLSGDTLETVATQVLEASRITGEAIDIDAMSSAFNQFKIEGEDTADAMDHLFRVSQATGIGMNDLASQAATAGPAMQQLGFSFEDTTGMIGAMDKAGLNSSQMLSGLSRSLVNLAKDGEEPAEAFERVVGEIEGFIESGDKAAAIDLASEVFGTRGAGQFVAALEDGSLAMDDLANVAGMTEDTILEAGEETMTFGDHWRLFANDVMVEVEPVATRLFEAIRDGMGWIRDTGVPALKDAAHWIKENEAWLKPLAVTVGALVAAWATYRTIMGVARGAQLAFNAVAAANPLGLLLTVIGLVVGALVYFFTQTETGRKVIETVWSAIKSVVSGVWDWLKGVFESIGEWLGDVGDWFGGLGDTASEVWDGIKGTISGAWDSITGTFDSLKDGLSSVGGWFTDRGEDIKGAWNGVRDGLSAGWSSIRDNVFGAFSDRFSQLTDWFENDSGAIGSTFRWLRDTLSNVWNWIDTNVFSVFRAAFSLVRSLFSGDSQQIRDAWDNLKNRLLTTWNNIRSGVFNPFRNAFNAVKNFFSNRVDDMKGYWNSLKGSFQAAYNWIDNNVFQRFRDSLSWLGDRVADARDRIRSIWETVANTFRRPINWVIRNVWNDGIASVFNRVADAIGIDTRLNTASELPMYAKGGHAKKGWALVGEEGPELVRFPQAGYVYTASETAGMLARGGPGTGEDFSESRPPDGGIWGGIANAVGSAVDWVRGGLADLAGAVLDPIVDRIAGGLSGYGSTGDLFGDTMNSAVDSLMDWVRGEDDVMKGVLGPGFKESGAAGRIQGATAAMNAAAWNIWNAIPGLRGMHSLSQSMVGPHRTGNAVDLYGPSSALQAAAAYAANNAAQLGIRQVIHNWRLWQGGGWGRLGSTGGNDPGHLWHVHVASHGGGARMWDAPRNVGRPGVYDDGGTLAHGQMALNLSRKPEAVLTNKQWKDISTVAQGGGERTVQQHFHLDPMSVRDLARKSAAYTGDLLRSGAMT